MSKASYGGPLFILLIPFLAATIGVIFFIINGILVPVLFAVSFIVFLYGIMKAYIFSIGDYEEVKKGHTLMLWGLIGFAVMISVWGIVSIVSETVGLDGSLAPPAPSSALPYESMLY